jgi:hypothetical protein
MVSNFADSLMTCFLQVLRCNVNSVQEDAMQAIAALVQAMGADFLKYMEAFYPFLEQGLKNFQEYQVNTQWTPALTCPYHPIHRHLYTPDLTRASGIIEISPRGFRDRFGPTQDLGSKTGGIT